MTRQWSRRSVLKAVGGLTGAAALSGLGPASGFAVDKPTPVPTTAPVSLGGDVSKIWLADDHEASHVGGETAQWHPAFDYAERYIPDRLEAPPEASFGGHGTSEYWMMHDFLAAARGEIASPIDVYRALDYTLPGILAVDSAHAGGAPFAVPDPRAF